MNAVHDSFSPDANQPHTAPVSPVGVVASVTPRSIICAMPAEAASAAGLTIGSVLIADGPVQAIATVSSLEAPAASVEADTFELVLIEAELKGRVCEEGRLESRITYPAVGEKIRLLNLCDALAHREEHLSRPITIGALGEQAVAFDADRALNEGLQICGSPLNTAPTLAVVLRALLLSGFPARLMLIDPGDLFTESFGAGASVVDASLGLMAPGYLMADEIETILTALGEPLPRHERTALARVARGQGGSFQDLLADLEDLALNDAGSAGLIRRLNDARDNPACAPFLGPQTDHLTSEEFLQTFFRLPDGRPPMAVCQLGQIDRALKPAAAKILLRAGRTLAQATGGRVPVLMAAHQADDLGIADAGTSPHFALIASKREAPNDQSTALIHTGTAFLMENEAHQTAAAQLGEGQSVLVEAGLPWPQRFDVDALPDHAVPGHRADGQAPAGDVQSLLEAVTQAFSA